MDAIQPITINGNTLTPGGSATLSFGSPAHDAKETDYIILQVTRDVLEDEEYGALRANGVELLDLVSDRTFLCRFTDTDLEKLRRLDFVSFVDTYKDDFVIALSLKPHSEPLTVQGQDPEIPNADDDHTDVDIVLHVGSAGKAETVKQDIVRLTGVDFSTVTAAGDRLRATLPHSSFPAIAKLDLVQAIVPVEPVKLMNDVAREIIHSDIKINGTAFKGKGQTICVADTGFDLGNEHELPEPFKNRSVKLLAVTTRGKTDDPDGHGTHVCGSAVGDGKLRDGTRIEAAASRADLIVQSILATAKPEDGLAPPLRLTILLDIPYKMGARVHTNSWGTSRVGVPYNQSSRDLDEFVYGHKDLVVCFAAGNSGFDATGAARSNGPDGVVDLGQIGAEAIAKNIISVGASESERPNVAWPDSTYNVWKSKFPNATLRKQHFANSSEDMAAFSSRGPALPDWKDKTHHRIKPDIVAPGTAILSTRSRHRLVRAQKGFGPSPDPDWMWEFGTSMSCPLVAGCCAVIREFLEQSGNPSLAMRNGRVSPSAALVKAILINGAVPLATELKTPNFVSGFGRINLERSIVPSADSKVAKAEGFIEGPPLRKDEKKTFSVTIPDGTYESFKVTLVWTDVPGKLLVNDLDLIVVAGGQERHGNVDPGSHAYDRINNVEQVTWENPPTGTVDIAVRAYNVRQLPGVETQDYALAWKLFA